VRFALVFAAVAKLSAEEALVPAVIATDSASTPCRDFDHVVPPSADTWISGTSVVVVDQYPYVVVRTSERAADVAALRTFRTVPAAGRFVWPGLAPSGISTK
jgi:hypothetical protein